MGLRFIVEILLKRHPELEHNTTSCVIRALAKFLRELPDKDRKFVLKALAKK